VTMRQSHAAGDKLFVDYAGDGVTVVIDRLTGEHGAAFCADDSAKPRGKETHCCALG
jgi:transposase